MCYPTNYNFLSKEKQEKIIEYMNSLSNSYNNTIEFASNFDIRSDLYKKYIEKARRVYKQIKDIQFAYSLAGIYLEYNWPKHEGWFLVTQEDVDYYEEYIFKCMEG